MAECPTCVVQLPIYVRRCPTCGSRLRREVRSDDERRQARLCHLLPLPGMLLFLLSWPVLGLFSLVPLNLIAPLIYHSYNPASQTIRTHTREVLNFQLLWTAVVIVAWIILNLAPSSVLSTIVLYLLAVAWLGGIALTVFFAYDLGNGGTGRYPLRISLF